MSGVAWFRRLAYRLGMHPRPGTILYSPSLGARHVMGLSLAAFEEGIRLGLANPQVIVDSSRPAVEPPVPIPMHPSHDFWVRNPRTGDGECLNCALCSDCDPASKFLAPCEPITLPIGGAS